MDIMEIILLIAGGIIFVLSFFLPTKEEKKLDSGSEKLAREEIRQMVGEEMDTVKGHVDDVVEEAVTYAMEKTERSLERLSNEKIMAVNEYSDTVLAEIHKNHEEAMFLYDMLNNKHTNLKNTVSEVNRTVKVAEETVNTFQKMAPDVLESDAFVTPETKKTVPEVTMTEPQRAKKVEPQREKKPEPVPRQEDGAVLAVNEAAGEDGRNSNEKILELYNQGKSRVAIAKELGLGVGEVKLVIDLYKNQ